MADENVPALAPTRSDDQILPFAAWVPIGKSNYVLDLQKKQKNPIFQISVDILQNTNFFRAFTASASVPAIYIQQFWNTLVYKAKTRDYSFQLDETRFVLDANLLREALKITPIDQAHQFVSPPSGDAIMDFVNELGYAENLYKLFRLFLLTRPIWAVPLRRAGKTRLTSASPFHLAEEDLKLGNLKFVPKGEEDEVFGMPIPNELISNNIRNASYYNAYLERVAKHDLKIAAEKAEKKKPATAKQPKPKLAKEKSSKPAPAPKPKSGIVLGIKSSTCWRCGIREPVAEATRPLPVVEDAETGAIIDKTNSVGDTEILQIGEEQGNDVTNLVNLKEKTFKIDEGQAGSDPGKTPESRPPPDDDKMDKDHAGPDPGESRVALAGPNPEPTHDEFMANVYPNIHESLKFPVDEHVILEDPLSSIGTLSSMKNLDDAFTIGDQFINDKSTKDEPEQLNVEAEVVSMVTVPIYQASSSVPPLSTPVIDLSSHFKPKFSNLEQKNKNLDNTTQNLGSRVFTLELRDLPNKIDEAVPDMKEILHQWMFESGTYKSLPEHVALYEALEASIERANRDEFLAEKDKSRKRHCDDQDPPPPPPDSDLSKKKRHDSDASGSSQPPAPQSYAWKTSDTKEAPSSSSKQ
ncbi:hypothetical protein Tco_0829945 [Tanacetum coccineum]